MKNNTYKKSAVKITAAFLAACCLTALPVSVAYAAPAQPEQRESCDPQVLSLSEGTGFTLTQEQKQLLEKMKEKLDAGELETEEQIREAVGQCEEELEITLTEEQKDQIVALVGKMNDLGLDSDEILSKAQELYEEYGEQIKKSADAAIQENVVEPVKEAVVEGTKSAIRDFFRDMGNSIRNFFTRLFS